MDGLECINMRGEIQENPYVMLVCVVGVCTMRCEDIVCEKMIHLFEFGCCHMFDLYECLRGSHKV